MHRSPETSLLHVVDHLFTGMVACMAGVQRAGKGERRECKAQEERAHFDFPSFLQASTQATGMVFNRVSKVIRQLLLFWFCYCWRLAE